MRAVVVAIIAITVGAIPLVQWILREQHGAVFGWVFGSPDEPMAYVVPLLVIVAGCVLIAVLEWLKKSS